MDGEDRARHGGAGGQHRYAAYRAHRSGPTVWYPRGTSATARMARAMSRGSVPDRRRARMRLSLSFEAMVLVVACETLGSLRTVKRGSVAPNASTLGQLNSMLQLGPGASSFFRIR